MLSTWKTTSFSQSGVPWPTVETLAFSGVKRITFFKFLPTKAGKTWAKLQKTTPFNAVRHRILFQWVAPENATPPVFELTTFGAVEPPDRNACWRQKTWILQPILLPAQMQKQREWQVEFWTVSAARDPTLCVLFCNDWTIKNGWTSE